MGEYGYTGQVARPAARRPSRVLPTIVAIVTLAAVVVAGLFVVRRATRPVSVAGNAAPIQGLPATPGGSNSTSRPPPPTEVPLTLAPALRDNQHADEVVALFRRYFNAINTRDYELWVSTLSQERVPDGDLKFHNDYSTTSDERVHIVDITEDGDGLVAIVSFRSHQDPSKAPTDSPYPCLDWQMKYPLSREAGELKISFVPKPNRSYRACPAS
jgi:hypothetical protein